MVGTELASYWLSVVDFNWKKNHIKFQKKTNELSRNNNL